MMTAPLTAHAVKTGLVFVRDGRVRGVLSLAQLRLLLAIEEHGEPLPVRQSPRVIWPDQAGALANSQRASAARSVTPLLERDLVVQHKAGGALRLTERGR